MPDDRRHDAQLTVLTVVLVLAFLGMCAWQVSRALSGNTLSWAYVFEWPLFAGYLIYMRGRLSRPGPTSRSPAAPDHRVDAEMAAYNRYLASLEEQDRR